MRGTRRQALVLTAGMAGTALVAQWARATRSADQPAVVLDTLVPQAFGGWELDALSRDFVRPAARDGLLYGLYDQLLERVYINRQGYRVMLSMAFGAEQSASLQLHQPEVCYRYSGYSVSPTEETPLALAGRVVRATRLQAQLPGRPEPITYWMVLGGLPATDLSAIRWRRVELALRRQPLDGLLVRVSSVDPDRQRAYALQAGFADSLVRALPVAERDKVVGLPPQG